MIAIKLIATSLAAAAGLLGEDEQLYILSYFSTE
jgi:hypothetical protein